MVGILGAIAIPAYNAYVLRGYMEAAQDALVEQAAEMQKYAQDHDLYPTSCSSPVPTTDFQISCSSTPPTTTLAPTYTLVAVGNGPAAGLSFTLKSDGSKSTTSSRSGWASNSACWTRDAEGDCAVQ